MVVAPVVVAVVVVAVVESRALLGVVERVLLAQQEFIFNSASRGFLCVCLVVIY